MLKVPSKTAQVLIDAKELIDTPDKWCQGRLENSTHTKHCAVGALQKVIFGRCFVSAPPYDCTGNYRAALLTLDTYLQGSIPHDWSIVGYNDHRSHADVMALFDGAIAHALATTE